MVRTTLVHRDALRIVAFRRPAVRADFLYQPVPICVFDTAPRCSKKLKRCRHAIPIQQNHDLVWPLIVWTVPYCDRVRPFSYWRLLGRPTRRKGISGRDHLYCGTFRPGVGGGLCQMSNLIFWMTLHTPLTVTERYRHSYDVFPDSNRTQPFGSGATCVYPYRDLMIRNDTQTTFRLHIRVGDKELQGEWKADQRPEYTYRIVEKEHCMKSEFWGGYSRHNKLYREYRLRRTVWMYSISRATMR